MPELVAIAEQLLAPVPGGTGRYTRELLRALAETAPEGWEISSVISRGDPEAARVPGVAGPRVLPLPRRALVAAWERGVPLWPGGDSVHAMTPLAPPAKRGRGLVVTVHDTVPWTHPETLTPRGVSWHRRAIGRAARQADALVVPTAAVAAELAEHVRAARLQVIGEGVTPALLAEPDPAVRLDLPERYVLAIGTVEPRKGYPHLVRAMADVPDVPLLVVGHQGWGGVDLARIAADCGVDRVRVLSSVSDAELAVLLRNATALAAPSLAEGFGLPLVEAMALGVPVVHSDAPALVEVAGGAGVVVPRADPVALGAALREVLGDPARREALIAAGHRRVADFTWTRVAREVWALHRSVTGDRTG
ncbi:Glycosyltransferase involved in cell wall bisynthesis [Saccharopolyspora antimicrobica]|uniref:Glycosyltransferase involved in cell wall biosynthesis n=1 Tax=Saccharopolyspora antimicrobica TaxID=455193 RepID=A0A1I5LCN9_9PSEU|nr:glycosyltransferase family 1 protein [Saccharopolyspora antimicrobica]RKT85429.1 glycosyltransferase involved in cell wall biosynthesis [Saccharopolyspora antimicrobica]SFO94481.1 Glycosyltransferase involved in cell wall bisynthesis [Saccharopolyspora antimicrobica]